MEPQIKHPAKPPVVVTSHTPRRRNRRSITCWCGAVISLEKNTLEGVDTDNAIYESCPLCEAARLLDRLKAADLFEAADPQ